MLIRLNLDFKHSRVVRRSTKVIRIYVDKAIFAHSQISGVGFILGFHQVKIRSSWLLYLYDFIRKGGL